MCVYSHVCMCMHVYVVLCVCACMHLCAWGWLRLCYVITCFSFLKKNCQLHCIRLGYFFFMGASVNIFKFQLRLFRRAFTVKNKPTTALLLFFNLWLEIHTADASSTVS